MPRRLQTALFILILAAWCTSTAGARAQAVFDDFDGQAFSAANWFTCRRDENEFSIVAAPKADFRAALMRVNPRRDLGLYAGFLFGHAECRREPGGQPRDNSDERAELWEADDIVLPFGSDVWYRFAMRVDPAVPDADVNRLVIGQWKQTGGRSPIVAQRFKGRRFTITIEQDFDSPLSYRGIEECRILLAHDAGYPQSTSAAVDWPRETWLTPPASALLTAAVAHGSSDSLRNEVARARPCARGVRVEQFAPLPDPFGNWVTMTYHIRPATDGTGVVEVWADDTLIARATGRIGFRETATRHQYFKFGPYRNRASYSTSAWLARYARGPSRDALDRR